MRSNHHACGDRCPSPPRHTMKCLLVMLTIMIALLQSGCATIMIQYKIDPARTLEETGSAPFAYLGLSKRYIYIASELQLYRFDKPAALTDVMLTHPEHGKLSMVSVGREGLRGYRARIEVITTVQNRAQSYVLKNGKPIEAAPPGMKMVEAADVDSITLYRERYPSMAKRGAYRTLGLIAGVGIDHLIISQPWSPEKRLLAELWIGYGIGCIGARGNSIC